MCWDKNRPISERVLVGIPAYNEEAAITAVVRAVRAHAPGFDLLVVDDGSTDATGRILSGLGVATARHLCNLGYGRSLQTAIRYAHRAGYAALVTFDADGQHRAEDLVRLYRVYRERRCDLLIGSRFLGRGSYAYASRSRALGMRAFSGLVRLLTGQRIYDTTSGFRIFDRRTFSLLMDQPFADFHAEAIVLLLRRGFRVAEEPIDAGARQSGVSMYSSVSAVKYPLKTSLAAFVALIGSRITVDRK
jgi:glycosyltransferase involved in cell wall biosynthesis